ncbi:DET1 homolog isoform X1 [Amphibalanus amphitrite]|uniref:DET1 homolog isoform X1 n=1 Tax=Amphibalanus amphitrite TaxID=1232801 RepID=UPI001C929640|nr:DET1 homolog isoform X1 [Amphibalanus amphitrite]XP_043220733.1 DET1 homolog isoform X1 [Amphibalanus amphitrite]XP_043220734.1 DET1 homolog isoform X1 [Amphibalanus amphitrite]
MASDADFLRPRRLQPQNLPTKLFLREIGGQRPRRPYRCHRTFYLNVYPNFTVQAVEKPACTLRKFTPDGRHIIAISGDQQSVEVYRYNGASAAAALLAGRSGDLLANSDPQAETARRLLFASFFTLLRSVRVAPQGENLNRECSLFTDDGVHVIVGSAMVTDAHEQETAMSSSRTNEWVAPGARTPLENYSLLVVDIGRGELRDTIHFKRDKIFTSHNQGLYLYGDTLAVLSVQHQTIHIYNVTEGGSIIPIRTVGRFCFDDDELFYQSTAPTADIRPPGSEKFICGLKHRLLVFLYHRAVRISEQEGSPYELRRFYLYFNRFRSLRMWKMQLLDSHHLLIRYASGDVSRGAQPAAVRVRGVQHGHESRVGGLREHLSAAALPVRELLRQLPQRAPLGGQPLHVLTVQQHLRQARAGSVPSHDRVGPPRQSAGGHAATAGPAAHLWPVVLVQSVPGHAAVQLRREVGVGHGAAQTVRRTAHQVLRARLWTAAVPDPCGGERSAAAAGRRRLPPAAGGVHIPPDRPVRHQCAAHQRRVRGQLPRAPRAQLTGARSAPRWARWEEGDWEGSGLRVLGEGQGPAGRGVREVG